MSKRFSFFLSHLLISFLIALLVIGLVFFIWYPNPLATAVGVISIFLMLLSIDVIVGPLLGLLVYKENKKTLKFDLAVIIIIQIFALSYGLYSLEQGRPVWIVYNVDRFDIIRKNDIIWEDTQQVQKQYQEPSWFRPQYTAIILSQNTEQRNNDFFAEAFSGISLSQKPERYIDVTKVKSQIQQRALNLGELENYNSKLAVAKILDQYPQADAWLPLKANALDMVVLIQKDTAKVVKIVDLRPWK